MEHSRDTEWRGGGCGRVELSTFWNWNGIFLSRILTTCTMLTDGSLEIEMLLNIFFKRKTFRKMNNTKSLFNGILISFRYSFLFSIFKCIIASFIYSLDIFSTCINGSEIFTVLYRYSCQMLSDLRPLKMSIWSNRTWSSISVLWLKSMEIVLQIAFPLR